VSVIAEFEKEARVIRDTLEAVPDVTVTVDGVQWLPESPAKVHFEAGGGDLDAFEEALAEDPTVTAFRRLSSVTGGRLYRATLSSNGQGKSTYHLVADQDGLVLHMTARSDTAHVRARFPSREALFAYQEACRERDIEFSLDRLFTEDAGATTGGDRFGLTEPQQEALLAALERGYFEVPRRTRLEAVADDLGISTQALSTRLRRAHSNLLRHTLAANDTI
jgi:predicted DNA binding protein